LLLSEAKFVALASKTDEVPRSDSGAAVPCDPRARPEFMRPGHHGRQNPLRRGSRTAASATAAWSLLTRKQTTQKNFARRHYVIMTGPVSSDQWHGQVMAPRRAVLRSSPGLCVTLASLRKKSSHWHCDKNSRL
jgi:hypothetical protein